MVPALDMPLAEEVPEQKRKIPIRDLGLTIAGTPLEPILENFERELATAGIRRVRPRFYLSTEWGVPYDTIAIAIPFYLARPELTLLQAEQACHVEGGNGAKDILRYLRHEMGHVINYAYRLHESKDWVERFGSMDRPYVEEYRPRPFSREYVHHLPGWYAQKHPDEDWAETFAVWVTPGRDWRAEYAKWPGALRKLEYCDRVMREIIERERDPVTTSTELDEDVASLNISLEQFYGGEAQATETKVAELDTMLKTVFADTGPGHVRLAASDLVRRAERDLPATVFQWTGHLPERTKALLDELAARADALELTYDVDEEIRLAIALTSLVTTLAMNWVQAGRYVL
ncbi:MAG: hypothetical protein U0235_18860 [Polyangiaceae bacterium]